MLIHLQEKRLAQEISDIERETGFKLRLLAQNYPETPGIIGHSLSSSVLILIFF